MSNNDLQTFLVGLLVIVVSIISISVAEYVRASQVTAQVSIVRKFDTCFVIYKDDIETIPCPPTEKQWQ